MRQILSFILFTVHFTLYAQKAETVTYDINYIIEAKEGTKKVRLVSLIPQDIGHSQSLGEPLKMHSSTFTVRTN